MPDEIMPPVVCYSPPQIPPTEVDFFSETEADNLIYFANCSHSLTLKNQRHIPIKVQGFTVRSESPHMLEVAGKTSAGLPLILIDVERIVASEKTERGMVFLRKKCDNGNCLVLSTAQIACARVNNDTLIYDEKSVLAIRTPISM